VEGPVATPRTALSDADGTFEVASLAPGRYTVHASAPGLVAPAHEVAIEVGATVQVDLALRLTAVDERLVVTAVQVDQPLARVPDSTTVIAGDDLEARQQFTASQALRSGPVWSSSRTAVPAP
jgi:outer membrane receptor protein involved in Fe transport